MINKRICDLAKEHNMSSKGMLNIINDLGFKVKSHLAMTSQEIVDAVVEKLNPENINIASQPVAGSVEDVKEDPKPIVAPAPAKTLGEVIFFSESKEHNIAYKTEEYFGNTAKIKKPAQIIVFNDYEYRTSDPGEIAWIKKTRSFTIRSTGYPNGKIRIVTEAQLAKLKADKLPVVKNVKSATDMERAGAVPGAMAG